MNSNTSYIKVVKASPWVEAEGYLPSRVVIWQPNDEKARQGLSKELQYTTHVETRQPDGTLSFCWGHYDMSLEAANKDFDERVDRLLKS